MAPAENDRQLIDIVHATDRNGVLPTAVALRSVLDSCSAPQRLRIHVAYDGLQRRDFNRIQETAQRDPSRTPHSLLFHHLPTGSMGDLLRSKNISRMAYARLFLQELVPSDAHRVIYLDFDVVVRRDVILLAGEDLGDSVLGAVANGTTEECAADLERLGVVGHGYFNSGVLSVDMTRWRADEVGPRALSFALNAGSSLIMHDQDALNAVLVGRWKPLGDMWNTWASHADATNDRIVHFTMSPKPWHADYGGRHQAHFFEAVDRTAFEGWRPASFFGIGAVLGRFRRRLPYLPTVLRVAREFLLPGRR